MSTLMLCAVVGDCHLIHGPQGLFSLLEAMYEDLSPWRNGDVTIIQDDVTLHFWDDTRTGYLPYADSDVALIVCKPDKYGLEKVTEEWFPEVATNMLNKPWILLGVGSPEDTSKCQEVADSLGAAEYLELVEEDEDTVELFLDKLVRKCVQLSAETKCGARHKPTARITTLRVN